LFLVKCIFILPKKYRRSKKKKRKNFSWKKLKAFTLFKKRLRVLGLAFLTVIISSVVLFSASLIKFFQEPLKVVASSTSLPKTSVWDGEKPYNLVLIRLSDLKSNSADIESLGILTLFPEGESFEVFTIPTEIDIEIPLRFGINPLFTVYKLGQLSDPPAGIALVERTLRNHLAIDTDGYVLTDVKGMEKIDELLGEEVSLKNADSLFKLSHIPEIPELISLVRDYVRTDLTTREIFKVLGYLRGVRDDKQIFTEITKGEFMDQVYIDDYRRSSFSETNLALEGESILMLNGTDTGGLARRYSRFLTNIGADIFAMDNAVKRYENSLIIADNTESYTVGRVSEVLGISDVRKKHEDQLIEEPDLLRADIAVILGFDKSGEL